MAATRKSEGALAADTGTSLSVPVPAVVAGDYLVMWLLQGGSATPPTISGWTLAYQEPNGLGGVGCIYYRVAPSNAAGTNQAVTVAAGGAAAKVSVWSGAGTDAPVVTTRVVETSATIIETPALTLPNPRGVLVFGFLNATRTAGSVSTNGTITATATARAHESILGAYQLSTITAAVTSAGGGTIRRAFTGGGTTAWTFAVVIPSAPPAAPTGLEVTGGTREFGVTFNSVSGADSYEIRRRRTDRTPPSPTNQPSPPWSLVQVNADEWTDDGSGAVVYAIDTGIRGTHVEFAGITVTGWNRPGLAGDWDNDTYGHGTEVASTAVGATRGVAKGADLHVVRIGADASVMPPLLAWFEAGVDEVLAHHAASEKPGVVIYSSPLPGDPAHSGDPGDFAAAVAKVVELLEAGIHVVMAEGNSAALETQMPSELHGKVLMVGGTTSAGVFWDDGGGAGSNYSPSTNLLAPAKDVPVAFNTGDSDYGTDTGTSFGAPMVAGAIAKMIAVNPHLSQERAIEALRSQATVIPSGQPSGYAIPLLNAAATTADWFTRDVGTSTSITDAGFGDGETYEYQVSTVDEGVQSAWSVSDSATTAAAGEIPEGSGALAYAFTLTGASVTPHEAAGVLGHAWGISGTGDTEHGGTGALSHAWALAGAGEATPKGAGGVAHVWSLTGQGSTLHTGTGTLDYAFVLSGASSSGPEATGTIGYGFDLTGSGERTPKAAGTLDHSFTLDGAGATTREGAGTLGYGFDLAGAGSAAGGGFGSIAYAFSLAGTTAAVREGSGALTHGWALDGSGAAPDVTVPTGTGHLEHVFAVAGAGAVNRRGAGVLGHVWQVAGGSHVGPYPPFPSRPRLHAATSRTLDPAVRRTLEGVS